MNKRKVVLGTFLVIFLIFGLMGYHFYQKIYAPSVIKSRVLYIKSSDNFNETLNKVHQFVKSKEDFNWVAKLKKYTNIKPGRYVITQGLSNNDLINLLRIGQQTPVQVSFNNQDTLEKLAARISTQIEADSISLLKAFTDKNFLTSQGITEAEALGLFIPNSYEFWWNTSAKRFRDRMVKEFNHFWNAKRKEKAKKLGLTPHQVMTLASIVQKETGKIDERPIVAGLYLNRLNIGMPLQTDPTIIYILKQIHGQDYTVKRVLHKDLEIKSPYNTYLNKGLPPSLIAMPDISSIDAVLNRTNHNFLYMCVDINNFGYHLFANNIHQHNRNAKKYQNWLTQQGVVR